MKTYFGFALGDSMFSGDVVIRRQELTPEKVKLAVARGAIPCCNPSHSATIHAMTNRFGIEVEIPSEPPRVSLEPGDSVIVMGVRGLPRMTDRHEYTAEEVARATFQFAAYTVMSPEMGLRETLRQTL
ncbi:MAG: hypothetical protein AAB794_01610 [Patescibacteria group bacterium]